MVVNFFYLFLKRVSPFKMEKDLEELKQELISIIWNWDANSNMNRNHFAIICGILATENAIFCKINKVYAIFLITNRNDIAKLKKVKQYLDTRSIYSYVK